MARDIVSEAVQQAEAMKEAAYENAKSVLVEAMSTNLKAAVTEAIDEQIEDADVEAVAETEDAMDEASIDERQKYGGNKGDESKSRRDFEEGEDVTEDEYTEDEDEEEIADDAYDVDDDAGDEEGEEDLEEMDIEEVIEIIEDEEDDDEDIDVDIDVDKDDDEEDDDDMDEDQKYGGNKGDESRSKRDFEAAIAENKSLKKQNARYEKALTFLKKRIDEVNLFNARLAAASDVMKAVTLTKEEKEQVVDHFDSCKNVNEVKRTFNVVVEAYTANDRVTKQRVERPNVQSVISEETKSEGDAQFDRLAELAGLK